MTGEIKDDGGVYVIPGYPGICFEASEEGIDSMMRPIICFSIVDEFLDFFLVGYLCDQTAGNQFVVKCHWVSSCNLTFLIFLGLYVPLLHIYKNPNKNPLVLIIRTRGISRVTTLIRMLFTQPASASAATLQCV